VRPSKAAVCSTNTLAGVFPYNHNSRERKKTMNAKRFLLLTISSFLFLTGMALSVQAQDPSPGYRPNPNRRPLPTPRPIAQPDFQPEWSVNGKIRWKKGMGVVPVNPSLENSIDNRCISFYVAALDPASGEPLRGDHSQMWKGADEGEYYVCRYTLKLPQNRKVRVFASMGGDGLLPKVDPNPLFNTTQWVGGNPSQSRPPQGAVRILTGSKYVQLDSRTTRASVDFEVIYTSPRSDQR
jgi:hypothetical protein